MGGSKGWKGGLVWLRGKWAVGEESWVWWTEAMLGP